MNKYELRTNNKKLSIINAATILFKERGFVDVSIKEIALEAKVSQVSIYNYFGNKDALVGECMTSIVNELLEHAREILKLNIPFEDKVNAALSTCSNHIEKYFYDYFTEDALTDKVLVNLIIDNINKAKLQLFKEYIEFGKEEGSINPNIRTDSMLRFLEIITVAESSMDNNSTSRDHTRDMEKLMLYGILGK